MKIFDFTNAVDIIMVRNQVIFIQIEKGHRTASQKRNSQVYT